MVVTIAIAALVAAALVWNIRRMVSNVRQGKSVDGCDGNCSHCHSCRH